MAADYIALLDFLETLHNYTTFILVFGKRAKLPQLLRGTAVEPLYNVKC